MQRRPGRQDRGSPSDEARRAVAARESARRYLVMIRQQTDTSKRAQNLVAAHLLILRRERIDGGGNDPGSGIFDPSRYVGGDREDIGRAGSEMATQERPRLIGPLVAGLAPYV